METERLLVFSNLRSAIRQWCQTCESEVDFITVEAHFTAHEKKYLAKGYLLELTDKVQHALNVRHYHSIMRNRALTDVFGPVGIALTAGLYAASLVGTRSVALVGLAAAISLLFGWIVHRRGSVVGVGLAHGILESFLVEVDEAVGA